jgi:hypothetical protein
MDTNRLRFSDWEIIDIKYGPRFVVFVRDFVAFSDGKFHDL